MNATDLPIYLDHAATTPTDPEVAAAMLPFLSGPASYGNPSSIHRYGREARAAVDAARDSVAALIHADYGEIYFTGSGTEADNLALIGTLWAAPPERDHLVTTAIEHHAVLHAAHFLQTQGYEVTIVPVDREGLVSPDAIAAALTDRTALVSVMQANNEIGTIQPIAEIAQIAHARGAKFHTDAVQTAGLLPVDVRVLDCDLLSLSAHKIYGPKGIGALFIQQGTKVAPLLHGGAQEREKRAGTENVAAIVGFGKAAELAQERREAEAARLTALRDRFLAVLRNAVPNLRLNGHPTLRLPNNVNVSVEGVQGATLLMNLDRLGVAASSGSACSSGSIEPSHVLKALGLPDSLASSGVRFTLGRGTTEAELQRAAELFAQVVHRLRK
ncbi:MAG TPA: IscS subfamily cysteine desulfurase [Chthonomonadaceae bacterium]|nr:IscS subfamily cysteine desulfurase [Chthonomonadaceae bacterium]